MRSTKLNSVITQIVENKLRTSSKPNRRSKTRIHEANGLKVKI